jgi:hypothetical protein
MPSVRRVATYQTALSLALSVLIACSDPLGHLAQRPQLHAGRIALAEATTPANTIEREPIELARQVPGFGGLWFDRTGNLHVFMVNLADSGKMRPALATVAAHWEKYEGKRPPMIFDQGVFDFRELMMWRRALSLTVAKIDGVQTLGVAHHLNRVRIGVLTADAERKVYDLTRSLDIPDEAVFVELEDALRPAIAITDSVRPLLGGVQISNGSGICTLGFNVNNGADFITASHCTNTKGPDSPLNITQERQPTGINAIIGHEVEDPEWLNMDDDPCCSYLQRRCTFSDAARLTYDSEDAPGSGQARIMKTDFSATGVSQEGGKTIVGSWRVVDYVMPYYGERVDKIGRTTGWTYGTIAYTCNDHFWNGWEWRCQVDVVGAYGGQGDSGGPNFHILSGDSTVAIAGLTTLAGPNVTTHSRWDMITSRLQYFTFQ